MEAPDDFQPEPGDRLYERYPEALRGPVTAADVARWDADTLRRHLFDFKNGLRLIIWMSDETVPEVVTVNYAASVLACSYAATLLHEAVARGEDGSDWLRHKAEGSFRFLSEHVGYVATVGPRPGGVERRFIPLISYTGRLPGPGPERTDS